MPVLHQSFAPIPADHILVGLWWPPYRPSASHIASIHLAAIRFCMLVFAKQEGIGLRVSEVRDKLVEGLMNLSFAKQLWLLFRALIHHGLSGIKHQLGCPVEQIMEAIEVHINQFFVQALQLDRLTLQREALDRSD